MQIKILTATVNAEKIGFSSETEFLVQVSKSHSSKSGYATRYKFKGDEFANMAKHYSAINIGNGYRKRVVMAGKVIIKERS